MLAKVWLDHVFVMTHCNLVLTTISMVEDITGSQVGGTFYPSSSGHVFLAFVLDISGTSHKAHNEPGTSYDQLPVRC